MSHTFTAADPFDQYPDVEFTSTSPDLYVADVEIVAGKKRLTVPGWALLAFVAEHVRNERMRKLENAKTAEVLGIEHQRTRPTELPIHG